MDTDNASIEALLSDESLDEYLAVALSNGFSKGTANVSPSDMKKLRPLLRFYAKKPHPFTACVRDNRKRFGPLTEKYCAIVKDLIKGTTKWRGKDKNMSEEELREAFALDIDAGFVHFVDELDEEDIAEMIAAAEEQDEEDAVQFAAGDVVWNPQDGFSSIRTRVQEALNEAYSDPNGYGSRYWVEDVTKDRALVCYQSTEYFIVPYSAKKDGISLGDYEEWTPVERAWVEANLSQEPQLLAEVFLGDTAEVKEEDGLVWKTVLREGKWKFSPGAGQKPVSKPFTVTKEGKTDKQKLTVSMADVMKAFKAGAVEHVTVPTTHADRVLENTGFVRKLRWGKDGKGRATIDAGIDFTEPDVKEKTARGTIANVSAGLLFDYVHKEQGKKFPVAMAHTALTNHPWLNGMEPFGVKASEDDDLVIVSFSEEPDDTEGGAAVATNENGNGGGSDAPETPAFLSELGLSEEEARTRLARFSEFEERERERHVDELVSGWQEAKKPVPMIAEAKAMLSSASDDVVLHLSEGGKDVGLSAADIVERLMDKAPTVTLADALAGEREVTEGERPNDDAEGENLSQEEKTLANQLYLEGDENGRKYTEQEAVAEAKKRLASGSGEQK